MVPLRFELQPKDKSLNLRLPGKLLDAIKAAASANGMPYQRFIRVVLERIIHEQQTKDR
jgi:predicted DNA binding CopG/RHH family protein